MYAYLSNMSAFEISLTLIALFDLAVVLAIMLLPKQLGMVGMFCSTVRFFSRANARDSVKRDGGRRTYFWLSTLLAGYAGLSMWAYSAGWMFCSWFMFCTASIYGIHTIYSLTMAKLHLRQELGC